MILFSKVGSHDIYVHLGMKTEVLWGVRYGYVPGRAFARDDKEMTHYFLAKYEMTFKFSDRKSWSYYMKVL